MKRNKKKRRKINLTQNTQKENSICRLCVRSIARHPPTTTGPTGYSFLLIKIIIHTSTFAKNNLDFLHLVHSKYIIYPKLCWNSNIRFVNLCICIVYVYVSSFIYFILFFEWPALHSLCLNDAFKKNGILFCGLRILA